MKILLKCASGLLLLLLLTLVNRAAAQDFIVNTAPLEGLDITPENMLGFQVQSTATSDVPCKIEGSMVFRSGGHFIKFSFLTSIRPGLNQFDPQVIHINPSYSSAALRELFTIHKLLPQGTYKYCITLVPNVGISEVAGGLHMNDCIYKQSKDLFSLTLIDPEDDAKLYEYNPMLSWVATYPFVNELTYRIRVAEIKQGQNTVNAIARNNPVYSENNLMSNSIVYPVYGKALRALQPYAWTVDAYYKGILLGGAEPWKFTIVEDTVRKTKVGDVSYLDINSDDGNNRYGVPGQIKVKYSENDFLQNELKIKLLKDGKELKRFDEVWPVTHGENFATYDISELRLRDKEEFEMQIEYKNTKSTQKIQEIKYIYVNPDFLK